MATAAPSAAPTTARRERQGVLLCVLSATCFGATVVLTKLAYAEGANVVTLLAARFWLAAVVLWVVAARLGVVRGAARRHLLVALLLGFIVYSTQTMLVFTALTRLSASLVELLVFCYPSIVVLGSIALRRERASRRRFLALATASAGIVLVLAGSSAGALEPAGAGLALLGACGYAAYVLVAAPLGERLHPVTLAALVCSGTATAFTLGGATFGTLDPGMPLAAWGWTMAIGLGTTVVALGAFLAGVARIGASRASILATLEPPIAFGLAFVLFGDRLTPLQMLGGLFVVLAVVILQLRLRRPARARGAAAQTGPTVAVRSAGQGVTQERRRDPAPRSERLSRAGRVSRRAARARGAALARARRQSRRSPSGARGS